VPECPDGSAKLWDGYSYVVGQSDETVMAQDLGRSTSCMRHYSQIPFIRCNSGGVRFLHYLAQAHNVFSVITQIMEIRAIG